MSGITILRKLDKSVECVNAVCVSIFPLLFIVIVLLVFLRFVLLPVIAVITLLFYSFALLSKLKVCY